MKNLACDHSSKNEENRLNNVMREVESASVDRTKFHIFSFTIYSAGNIFPSEEKRMSCGKCGPKKKVKTMPKKKATKKKKK